MNGVQENNFSFAFDEAIKVEYKGNVNGIDLYSGYCSKEWRIGLVEHGGTEISLIVICGVVVISGSIFFLIKLNLIL
jgi:hypothetical protein